MICEEGCRGKSWQNDLEGMGLSGGRHVCSKAVPRQRMISLDAKGRAHCWMLHTCTVNARTTVYVQPSRAR